MKALVTENNITLYPNIPKDWNNIVGYQYKSDGDKYNDGWRDFVDTEYNHKTHKKTNVLIESGRNPNKKVSYKVIPLTQVELDALEAQRDVNRLPELYKEVASLKIGALSLAIGKPELSNENEINAVKEIYEQKYQMAKGEINDDLGVLQPEAEQEGYTLADWKTYIIERYEQGKAAYVNFLSMIDRTRTKAIHHYSNNEKEKFDTIIDIYKSIERTTPLTDIQNKFTEILSL